MPIFPGPVSHNNPNAPILKLDENQVRGMGIFADIAARDNLNLNLRIEGYIAVVKDTDQTFMFTSSDMADWGDASYCKSQKEATYTYTKSIAGATWVITHGLNKYPSVTVVDTGGSIVRGEVVYNTINQLTITFFSNGSGTAVDGKAYLN